MTAPERQRPAHVDDLAALAGLRARAILASTGGPYSASELAAWAGLPMDEMRHAVSAGDGSVLVAEQDRRMLGFAWASAGARPHLRSLYVDPASQRRGVGSRLLEAAQQWVRAGRAECLFVAASMNAVGFYVRHGYVAEGPFSWRVEGDVALRMCKMVRSLATGSRAACPSVARGDLSG